jgi:hypothetical protein
VCLAQFLVDINGPDEALRIVSIDQEESYAAKTRDLLQQAGLAPYALVLCAPLREQVIAGVATTCYEMPDLDPMTGMRRADFVLIDGPAAATRMRFGTLPLARPFISGRAEFALDDGLRDGEIWIAGEWARLPGIRVNGILDIGKGLVVGQLTGVDA